MLRGGAWRVAERETWEAFWEGGPRKSEGGGSRTCLARGLGDSILRSWNVDVLWWLLNSLTRLESFGGCGSELDLADMACAPAPESQGKKTSLSASEAHQRFPEIGTSYVSNPSDTTYSTHHRNTGIPPFRPPFILLLFFILTSTCSNHG